MLLPLQGASLLTFIAQDDALGYVLVAPSGRIVHNTTPDEFYFFSEAKYSSCR